MTKVKNFLYFISDLINGLLLFYAILIGAERDLLILAAVTIALTLKIAADILR